MKKLFTTLLLASACVLSSYSQSEHMTFKGIPIDGTLEDFCSKIAKKGFTITGLKTDIGFARGDFAGFKNCTVYVNTSSGTGLVTSVGIIVPSSTTWAKLYGQYSGLRNNLTSKYGAPTHKNETFKGKRQPADDIERILEVRLGNCRYSCTFESSLGIIDLSINHLGLEEACILLVYTDRANESMAQEAAKEDL